MIGATEYADPSKDSWRGWKWNTIARLICGDRATPSLKASRLQNKTVLYLAGPQDLDRRKALSHGFANHNLIAVDVVRDRIQAIRDDGGFGICSSMQAVLFNWPGDWHIDVIDCDLCAGIVEDTWDLSAAVCACRGVSKRTVFSGNFLRGRDQASNRVRRLISDGVVRRSEVWCYLHCQREPLEYMNLEELNGCTVDREYLEELKNSAVHGSYVSKTSGQTFDSVIHYVVNCSFGKFWDDKRHADESLGRWFRKPTCDGEARALERYKTAIQKHSEYILKTAKSKELSAIYRTLGESLNKKCRDKKAHRKIAAMRAMRTARTMESLESE